MELLAKIVYKEANYERVVLCQFKDKDENLVFIEETELNGRTFFHVLLDEGYCRTHYQYPADRYVITELEVYK